jgi:hypothetical protein
MRRVTRACAVRNARQAANESSAEAHAGEAAFRIPAVKTTTATRRRVADQLSVSFLLMSGGGHTGGTRWARSRAVGASPNPSHPISKTPHRLEI